MTDDLFGGMEPEQPKRSGFFAARPWAGCDTYSEEWRIYCEAWQRVFKESAVQRSRYVRLVGEYRGYQAAEALKANMVIVQQDWDGHIPDRTKLPSLLRRPADMPAPPKGWKRR